MSSDKTTPPIGTAGAMPDQPHPVQTKTKGFKSLSHARIVRDRAANDLIHELNDDYEDPEDVRELVESWCRAEGTWKQQIRTMARIVQNYTWEQTPVVRQALADLEEAVSWISEEERRLAKHG